jgi:hypothetical protein
MVTGVEEEMKVTSNDDKKQQDKPTETGSTSDNYQSANHSPFISPFPTLKSRIIFTRPPFAFLQPVAYLLLIQ